MAEATAETTTTEGKTPPLEFKIHALGIEVGLDLARITFGEAALIEQRTGRRYGEILYEAIRDGGFAYTEAALIAGIALHRVDDEKSVEQYVEEIYEQPIDSVQFKAVSADDEGPVGPTKPKPGPKSKPATSGSRN